MARNGGARLVFFVVVAAAVLVIYFFLMFINLNGIMVPSIRLASSLIVEGVQLGENISERENKPPAISNDPRIAEDECYYMHELNPSKARHKATLAMFEALVNAHLATLKQQNSSLLTHTDQENNSRSAAYAQFSCGCLRLEDEFNLSKSCLAPSRPRSAECVNSKWKWIVLVGDSTMREMLESVIEATTNDTTATALHQNETASRDYIIYSLRLVVSFRINLLLDTSRSLNIIRRPQEAPLLVFPANISLKTRYFRNNPFRIISDLPRFIRNAWKLINISHQEVSSMERCGPELFVMSSGLWENDGYEPEFETRECGMPAQPTIRMLWDRRLRTVFGEACELYGNRFIWRTSPSSFNITNLQGSVRFAYTDDLNRRATAIARQYGVQVMDYHALFDAMGLVSKDHIHPLDIVRLRCWANILEYASKVLGDSHMLPFANRLQALYRIQLSEFRLFLSSINASTTKVDYKANMGVNYTGRYYWGKTSTRSRVIITPWTYDRVSRISEELSREEKSFSAPWSVKVPSILQQ